MLDCGIYQLKFPSGKIYVGSSKRISNRIRKHERMLIAGSHCNPKMTALYKKYKKFKSSILLICREEDLLLYEQSFIDFLKPHCNCTFIAGRIDWNEETRARLAKTRTGMRPDAAVRKLMSEAQTGKKRDQASIEKARIKNTGQKRTQATKDLLSLRSKGRPKSASHIKNVSLGKTGVPWSAAQRAAHNKRKEMRAQS